MISSNQCRKLRPGQMMTSDEWNAVVQSTQNFQPRQNGFTSPYGHTYRKTVTPWRETTPCISTATIPAYSVFPLKPKLETGSIAVFDVEAYDPDHVSQYLEGYIGTNGATEIPANVTFYATIISDQYDCTVSIPDYADSATECGFADGLFTASKDSNGLFVAGKAPIGEDLYFVRKGLVQETEGVGVIVDSCSGGFNLFGGRTSISNYAVVLPSDTDETITFLGIGSPTGNIGSTWILPNGTVVQYRGKTIIDAFVPDLYGQLTETSPDPTTGTISLYQCTWNGESYIEADILADCPVERDSYVVCSWMYNRNRWVAFPSIPKQFCVKSVSITNAAKGYNQ